MNPCANPDQCIACTTCVVSCPIARVATAFPGPRMIGPAYERFRLLGLEEDPSLDFCSNCKNCDISCPNGVPVSTINMLARAARRQKKPAPLRDWFLAHGETLARKLRLMPAVVKNAGMLNPLSRTLLDILGIDARASLPRFAPRTFRKLVQRLSQPENGKKVVIFPGCFLDIYDPQTGMDLVWVLNRAGYRVEVPDDFVCCGLPLVANGYLQDARRNARKNCEVLERYRKQEIPVLAACPSCSLMLDEDVRMLFPDIFPTTTTKPPLMDAQVFLLECIDRGELQLPAGTGTRTRLMYHAPCHMRAQGIGLPSLDLLQALPDLEVHDAAAGCCGISGSYGFKKEKYSISMRVGASLFETIRASGARYVASECGTCRLQIRHGTGLDCLHPVTIFRHELETATAAARRPATHISAFAR